MLNLTMMNDSGIALKFKATIRILFEFGRIVETPYAPVFSSRNGDCRGDRGKCDTLLMIVHLLDIELGQG